MFMCFAYLFLPSLGNSKITIEKASKFEHLPHVHKILKKMNKILTIFRRVHFPDISGEK